MKPIYLLLAIFAFTNMTAQEYWNRKDFEIGNRGIDIEWREFSFSWQNQSNFNLPDGSFLHLKNEFQKDEIDMLAVIDKANRNKVQRQLNLGSPLPQKKDKEKKLFEITGDFKVREPNDVYLNPYYTNPFFNNYYQPVFPTRRYSPYRYGN
jgi:hypothetical protein